MVEEPEMVPGIAGAAEMVMQREAPTYPQEVTPDTQSVPLVKPGPKVTVAEVPVPTTVIPDVPVH
jgi:hypothetical protein